MSKSEKVETILNKQLERLRSKQEDEKTKGRACAITKIEEAIMWLNYEG